MRLAVDCNAVHAERESRRDLGECRVGAGTARQAVGDDADLVSEVDLSVGEIEDMSDDASDRRTHGMEDSQRLRRCARHLRVERCARQESEKISLPVKNLHG